ncbi:MAG: MopE-related protein [Agriterribacter sp.]
MKIKVILSIAILIIFFNNQANSQSSFILGSHGTVEDAGDRGPLNRPSAENAGSPLYSRHFADYSALLLCKLPINSTITKIAWYKGQNGSAGANTHNFTVYLKNSDDRNGAGPWNELISGATKVYENNSLSIPTGEGWWELELQTPFVYTGGTLTIYTDWYSGGTATSYNQRTTGRMQFNFVQTRNGLCGGVSTRGRLPLNDWDNLRVVDFYSVPNIKLTYSGGGAGRCGDADGDGLTTEQGDCDDNDATKWRSAEFYIDKDGDGYDNGKETVCYGLDIPVGYSDVTKGADCEDNDKAINPETIWYKDLDDDGYSDGATKTQCDRPTDYKLAKELISLKVDCDDTDKYVHPTKRSSRSETGDDADETCKVKIELLGLEVNQVIQDLNNSVPLIADKPTIVRAIIRSNSDIETYFETIPKLIVKRDGKEDIIITSDNWKLNDPVPPKSTLIDTLRSHMTSTVVFTLNESLTDEGFLDLKFDADCDCKEAAGIPNDCSIRVKFQSSPDLKIIMTAFSWEDDNGKIIELSTHEVVSDHGKAHREIEAMFPTPIVKLKPFIDNTSNLNRFHLPKTEDWKKHSPLVHALAAVEALNKSSPKNIYLAAINAKLAEPDGQNVTGEGIYGVGAVVKHSDSKSTYSHEMGHVLGLEHVPLCGAKLHPWQKSNFPQENILYGFREWNVSEEDIAGIGPMGEADVNKRIFGFDTRYGTILSPFNHFELMSYCQNLDYYQWPSQSTYKRLLDSIKKRDILVSSPINKKSTKSIELKDNLLFYGIINNDLIAMDPVLLLPNQPEIVYNSTSSTFQLQLLNSQNEIVSSVNFEPNKLIETESLIFSVPILKNETAKKAIILKNNKIIAEKIASDNKPIVSILFPKGKNIVKSSDTIRWQAYDKDGDTLYFVIQLSADGGNTWETVAFNYTDTTLSLKGIAESKNAVIRILVSDGFNTAMTESDNFIAANSIPEVYILIPEENTTVVGDDILHFESYAYDTEDGKLKGESITWNSDKDGDIGHNDTLTLKASMLSEGVHKIKAIATDKNGNTSYDSVIVSVHRSAPPFSIECRKDTSVSIAGNECFAELTFTDSTIGSKAASFVYSINENDISLPYEFPIGSTVVQVTAVDSIGRKVSCSFNVIVTGNLKKFYRDKDADGYGDINSYMESCTLEDGFVENSSDCNDNDASVHPGAPEFCDGKDNNCDGVIDEGCGTGTTGAYYSKPSGDLYNLTTWGTNPDGSGTTPTDFGDGKTFTLANRANMYTLTGNWSLTGTLNIPSDAQLAINGNTLLLTTLTGTGTVSGSATSSLAITGNGDFGTLHFSAGDGGSLKAFTLNRNGTVTIGSALSIYDILTVTSGTLNTGNWLTLKSNAENTARLAPVLGTISGNVTVERYIPARRAWRLMNAPVDGEQSVNQAWQEGAILPSNPNPGYGTIITAGPADKGFDQNLPKQETSIKTFNNEANNWINVTNTKQAKVGNIPYFLFIRGDRSITTTGTNNTTLRATGPLLTGNQTIPVAATGFTAVANPFASPVNFASITRNNVANGFYVWDPKLGSVGAYVNVSYGGNKYDTTPKAVSDINELIQSGQSFLVNASGGKEGSIIIKESDKSNTAAQNVFRAGEGKSNTQYGIRINLQANTNGNKILLDEVFASYSTSFSDEIDNMDALKADNVMENLAIIRKGQSLMVDRRNLIQSSDTLRLNLTNTSAASYMLEFSPIELSGAESVTLTDNYLQTNTDISLTATSQVFFQVSGDSRSSAADRFSVIIVNRKGLPALNRNIDPTVIAYPNPATGSNINLKFDNIKGGAYTIELLNNAGQVIYRKLIQLAEGSSTRSVDINNNIISGIYQVRITGRDMRKVVKILKR